MSLAKNNHSTETTANTTQTRGFKLPKSVKLFLLRFAHSNAYVSIPILAITVTTYMQIGNFNLHSNYLAFLFFSTLFLYPLHRLIGIRLTIPVDYSMSQKSVSKKPTIAQASVIIGFIGTLYFTLHLPHEFFQFLIPLGLVSLTYSLPFIPTSNGWKRLRDIPGIKIYAITFVVTVTTSTIPLLLIKETNFIDMTLFGAERFLFILAITIPFDIRDERIDKKWNLKTIPLLIGTEKALNLSKYLLIASGSLTVFQVIYSPLVSIYVGFAILLSYGWAYYIIEKFKVYNAPLFNAYMVEGTMVFKFALVTMVQVLISL